MLNDNTSIRDEDTSCIFVILGGTGDLTKKKLIPAIYKLFSDKKISKNFALVSVGRKNLSHQEYRDQMEQNTIKYGEHQFNKVKWDEFADNVYYNAFDMVDDNVGYRDLDTFLKSLDNLKQTKGNRIYYLAVGPNMFIPISKNLKNNGMLENQTSWQRIIIEKPFGYSLDTALELQNSLLELIPEEKIFRIDHYLGKEMLQNIIAIRFSNSIFESLWNHKYIDNIQINSSETIGVEHRGSYYEKSGVLRDMLQSHILQMLSLICMEPPINLDADSIRDEKVKVLKSLQLFDKVSAKENIVLGQYGNGEDNIPGYRDEENVDKNSIVPTYISLKAGIKNYRWGGVPIYIRAGKRLDKKSSEIIIQFKKLPGINIYDEYKYTEPDYLIVKIQPEEGIKFQINIKKPDDGNFIEKVEMNYCQTCRYDFNSPKAYEKLILEIIKNSSALFTRWDEVEAAWKYVDSIENSISKNSTDFPNYKAGSIGPEDASILMGETKIYRDIEGDKL
ncbi:glucose-6-phosphate dehydrogenase [Proteocatella sphenisci]|uniref:glucose-6-phosphate dehydrogenase n=1 Tax=Proteocatella sphenisci TaxID=181070 RepID=UPI0004BC503F|nr:glucose-6-phosphate dehydrogenase [Proteocatella sphenisci]